MCVGEAAESTQVQRKEPMSQETQEIIGLDDWLQTPPGQRLLAWEHAQCAQAVADVFGYHAVQLGLPDHPLLRENRMPWRCLAGNCASPVPICTGWPR